MKSRSTGQTLLIALGALCCTAGFLAWVAFAWKAIIAIDELDAEGELGTQLMKWGVIGTVLMIAGMILFHVVQLEVERDES